MNYPDLSGSKVISFDIETYDPKLLTKGPGVYRRDGFILGVSIADNTGYSEFYDFNCGKKVNEGSDLFSSGIENYQTDLQRKNISYIKDVLCNNAPKIGANVIYDMDWLTNFEGIKVNGRLHDIQLAEPLIDAYAKSYSLDTLSKKYLNRSKEKSEIQNYCDKMNWSGDPRKHLYKMPYETIRSYAIADAVLPIEIYRKQYSILKDEELQTVYDLECDLLPLLLQMRKNGIRIDEEKARFNYETIKYKIENEKKELVRKYGSFNYNSTLELPKVFDKLGIEYPFTEKGNPSITKGFLENNDHDISQKIIKLRQGERVLSAFFENVCFDKEICIDGKIHTSFNQLRSDEKGTLTGRFSSTNPNLQQVPSKDDCYGNEARSCFIPENGYFLGKVDYSQIEFRGLVHYAEGLKSEEVRNKYRQDPLTDYHRMVQEWTGLPRKTAKILNFGTIYGMGIKKACFNYGWNENEAKEFFNKYRMEVPFLRNTMNGVIKTSKERGFIKTILGRRARVSAEITQKNSHYKLFNYLIQGSAADIMKKAMVDCFKAGLFNYIIPHLTIHDELVLSVPKNNVGLYREVKKIMENCVKLRVPIIANAEIGSSWGETEELK